MTSPRKPLDREAKAAKPWSIVVNKDRCKGCSFCVDFCPKQALVMGKETNAKGYLLPELADENKCSGCGICEALCPDFALRVVLGEPTEPVRS